MSPLPKNKQSQFCSQSLYSNTFENNSEVGALSGITSVWVVKSNYCN